MERKKFSIPNITCGHCVMTIQRELGELRGIEGRGRPLQEGNRG